MISAPMSTPRRNCSGAVLDGRIFSVGGFDGNEILKTVETLDTRMKSWINVKKNQYFLKISFFKKIQFCIKIFLQFKIF
jgi:hypothetical protein